MSPYGRPRPANGDSSRKSSSSSRRRSRSLTSNFLFLWVCLTMAFSPPPFFTFSLNSTYLQERQRIHELNASQRLFAKPAKQNLLLKEGFAVSEVGFINVAVDGKQRLLQHWEGTAQSLSLPACRAHTPDRTVPRLLSQPAAQNSQRI